jgi:hypothetical protein
MTVDKKRERLEDLPVVTEQAAEVKGGLIDPNNRGLIDPNVRSFVDPNVRSFVDPNN